MLAVLAGAAAAQNLTLPVAWQARNHVLYTHILANMVRTSQKLSSSPALSLQTRKEMAVAVAQSISASMNTSDLTSGECTSRHVYNANVR